MPELLSTARVAVSCLVGIVALAAESGVARAKPAADTREAGASVEARSWNYLTTGNGHGFQVFDASRSRITQFLERPYRFVGKNEQAPDGPGIGRKNLAYDSYFGLRAAGGAGWLPDVPGGAAPANEPSYVDQTNIIRAPASAFGVAAESFFFAPFGLERNVMVGLLHAPGATDGYALLNFHLGARAGWDGTEADARGEWTRPGPAGVGGAVIESGPSGGAMVYVPIGDARASCKSVYANGKAGQDLASESACSGDDLAIGFQRSLDAGGWMGFVSGFVDDASLADGLASDIAAWLGARTADRVLADARSEWDAWRKPLPAGAALCSDDETKVWRMGEATLRMGQIREPNVPGRTNHGMMLAALPVGEWHIGWVRDATYAIAALSRSGHFAEAKAALDFFLNTEPVGKYASYVRNQAYRISVTRYFGSGEEETDFNQDGPNIEIDGWGMVLWAARQYVQASGDVAWLSSETRDGSVWDVLTGGIADPLAANLEESGIAAADASIWEVHEGRKKHFAWTTLSAARGFCDMAAIARLGGRADVAPKYQALEKRVREGFLASFQDGSGALAGSVEELASGGGYTDVAAGAAFTWNILRDYESPTARNTVSLLESLKVATGGYKRNDDSLSSYDDNEWVFADLVMANAYRKIGRPEKSDAILGRVVAKASANLSLIPELFNAVPSDGEIGKATGAVPMVGYGAGAYILSILDRSGGAATAPDDCGDGANPPAPPVACATVLENLRHAGLGELADGADDQATAGCACDVPHRDSSSQSDSRGLAALLLSLPVLLFVRRRRSQ